MSDSSTSSTPTHFSVGESSHFYDPNYSEEISHKMRVPKRIKIDGESDDPIIHAPSFEDAWMHTPSLDMRVPDRIVVLDEEKGGYRGGNNEHFGTKSFPPPEIAMENSVRRMDNPIHIQTPPRVLTLDKHNYPSATEYAPPPYFVDEIPRPAPRTQAPSNEIALPHNSSSRDLMNMSDLNITHVEGMSAGEEVIHLRRQLAKLNRRVMAIELDNMQRHQRDKILYAVGLAYVFIKALVWLSRSN